jgi:hypothetical protein
LLNLAIQLPRAPSRISHENRKGMRSLASSSRASREVLSCSPSVTGYTEPTLHCGP